MKLIASQVKQARVMARLLTVLMWEMHVYTIIAKIKNYDYFYIYIYFNETHQNFDVLPSMQSVLSTLVPSYSVTAWFREKSITFLVSLHILIRI